MQLDLTGEFFKGERKTEQEAFEIVEDALREDATFNIVGKRAVEFAIKSGIINQEGVMKIQGIPIALNLL